MFNASLKKHYETVELDLNASRAINPSGSGVEVLIDSQTLILSKNFTARLRGDLSAYNYNYSPRPSDVTGVSRHYYKFSTGLFWNWTRELDVHFGYQYQHNKRAAEDQDATSNAIYWDIGGKKWCFKDENQKTHYLLFHRSATKCAEKFYAKRV